LLSLTPNLACPPRGTSHVWFQWFGLPDLAGAEPDSKFTLEAEIVLVCEIWHWVILVP
jgi:hypothetical protein